MNTPTVLNDFAVYTGERGEKAVGTANITLPEISAISSELNQAGIAGKISVPVIGHFDSMAATINFTMLTGEALDTAVPIGQQITARGAIQVLDASLGVNIMQSCVVVMRGTLKTLGLGKFEKGSAMDSSVAVELDYLKLDLDGNTKIEIDKFNSKYVVNGVDYLADVKAIL